MDQQDKYNLLVQARAGLSKVQESIGLKITETLGMVEVIKEKIFKLPPDLVPVQKQLLSQYSRRTQELSNLRPSPYFIKCEIRFDAERASRIFYFSKFAFPEEHIYSWTSPAAAIRFEKPGKFSYPIKDFDNKTGELLSKEQFMIADGKIVFMAVEGLDQPRELVYQEYFSQRKSTFILPEIVEQMEKSQDKVIRADAHGSFLISGPAGSGKTTLALHRVAYLVQSPDTANKFQEADTIVFVQDASTKAYFGGLLPQLGINNVLITTFPDWAREQLKLFEIPYVIRYGNSEQEQDAYEYEKYQALKLSENIKYSINVFELLEKSYIRTFSAQSLRLFQSQKLANVIDRFDLTLLMRAYINTNKGIFTEDTEYKQLKGGKVQRKKILTPVAYSLIVLDEVQNYLPEQITILRSCINQKYHALVYVGDLAQQTQLCTIRDWTHAGEQFEEDRKVTLQKNYRSTKQILEFIKDVGYTISVPQGIKEGSPIKELYPLSTAGEIEYIQKNLNTDSKNIIGILSKSQSYLIEFKSLFVRYSNVRILTINEAQGVEFDTVFLVGIKQESFSISEGYVLELKNERRRVNRDLLYVALTRAMNELHVLGQCSIKEIINDGIV